MCGMRKAIVFMLLLFWRLLRAMSLECRGSLDSQFLCCCLENRYLYLSTVLGNEVGDKSPCVQGVESRNLNFLNFIKTSTIHYYGFSIHATYAKSSARS
jgi:hypothetical protein